MANQHTERVKRAMTDAHRDKIKTSQLINRLFAGAMGKVEMTPVQVTAAKALLNKVLPDLQATTVTGDITHSYVAELPEVSPTVDEWQKQAKQTLQ